MKQLVLLALVLLAGGSAVAEPAPLKLVSLKPRKVTQKKVGKISATLINVASDDVIDRVETLIGDCGTCARGIAVRGVLGIRIRGKSLDELEVIKKSAPGVKYQDCKQTGIPKGGEFQCTFSWRERTYTMKLVSSGRRKRK